MPEEVAQREVAHGTFAKLDEERRLVFGWASVVAKDGEPLEDAHGDVLDLDALENAVYLYNIESRAGDEMHERMADVDLVESFMVTPEKLGAMGLAKDAVPLGWWMGFRVNDDALWASVKDGTYRDFSIVGAGIREPL